MGDGLSQLALELKLHVTSHTVWRTTQQRWKLSPSARNGTCVHELLHGGQSIAYAEAHICFGGLGHLQIHALRRIDM